MPLYEVEIVAVLDALVRQYVRVMRYLGHEPTDQELNELREDIRGMLRGDPDALEAE